MTASAEQLKSHIAHLEAKHAELDKQVDNLEKNGLYEDLHLEEIKKHRLVLKDQIEFTKAKLNGLVK
jgi:hypothetical protein